MVVSKSIHFEDLISITKNNEVLFNFLHKNNALLVATTYLHEVCVIFICKFQHLSLS